MDVLLILHVSRSTKITVTLFTIISTHSPQAAKNREARLTALCPISLITGRVTVYSYLRFGAGMNEVWSRGEEGMKDVWMSYRVLPEHVTRET